MFDLFDPNAWSDEPDRRRIEQVIEEMKLELIQHYGLRHYKDTADLVIPRTQETEGEAGEYLDYYIQVRHSLTGIIGNALREIPNDYRDLFVSVLTDWMPEPE